MAALTVLCLASGCQERKTVEGFPEHYVGIGLELTMANEHLTVVRPIEGGPSAAAGIKKGDRIVAINGRSTEAITLGDAVVQLRGEPDSQLTLALERSGEKVLVVLKRRALRKVNDDYHVAGSD